MKKEQEEQEAPILHSKISPHGMDVQRNEMYRKILRGEHNYLLSALCISFGMATWLPVNAIYTQMPLLTQQAPEGWSLPSYFSVLVQIANVAPIAYYFIKDKRFSDAILICFFLLLGTISLFLLSFTYYESVSFFGAKRSLYFFLFAFFLSLVGCVSSVLFLPYVGKLPEVYLVSYFIGEGLSGFVPSLLALAQGVSKSSVCANVTESGVTIKKEIIKEPLFSSGVFLMVIAVLMLFNTLCFLYLNYFSSIMSKYSVKTQVNNSKNDVELSKNRELRNREQNIPKILLVSLLIVQCLVNCFSNGILPSIMSYSCLPYGTETYHWSVSINQIVGPLSSYFAYFIPLVSVRLLVFCCVVEVLCVNYELITALTSPVPPMVGTNAGVAVIILVWMFGSGLISYIKLSIAAILRRRHEKALFNYGVVTQVGSAIGSILAFILINYAKILHSVPKEECV